MADGLCSGDSVGGAIEKTPQVQADYIMRDVDGCDSSGCGNDFYMTCASDELFEKLRARGGGGGRSADGEEDTKHEGFLDCEDDCRKKRCVDRYDSSESSDSGVAVLSCTDCSGSSTASSDITDPGSPFSTASSHSEDSASQPSKMPPTQTAHLHQPWPWTAEEGPAINKRSMHHQEKTASPKRLKSSDEEPPITNSKQSPSCLNASSINNNNNNHINNVKAPKSAPASGTITSPATNENYKAVIALQKKINNHQSIVHNNNKNKLDHQKQGKITEYFKSQIKLHVIKKESPNSNNKANGKFVSLVDQHTQVNGIRPATIHNNSNSIRGSSVKKPTDSANASSSPRARKIAQVSVPRKILPAPSKVPENLGLHQNLANFTPTVTLTAVGFPPNLTYIHTKSPKPPDSNGGGGGGGLYVPQFATLSSSDKINGIPIINRTPCLNVIQHHHHHHQKITTINNFNCVKLNATVVPIVKLNALPSSLAKVALSVETAAPTVLTAKSKVPLVSFTPKQQQHGEVPATATTVASNLQVVADCGSHRLPSKCQVEEAHKPPDEEVRKSPSPDSDSGISLREHLEVVTAAEPAAVPALKSPILSQPKTIRFPAKQGPKDEIKYTKSTPSVESGLCRWAECNAQFDTSGALLEHLQVKHVISQAAQEQYVCLWLGCKVHGRTSCSRSWLERHVLAHAGTKPFRCIVDGCGQRFNSQTALERHVNGHFSSDGSQNGSTKKSTESSSSKLFKRNGKKIRFRRQPWSARMFDFIDSGIMEGLQHKLLTMTENGTLGGTVDVMSRITARRVEPNGSVKLLVKWDPAEIIPDEWVLEQDYVKFRTVPIPSLHSSVKDDLHSRLFATNNGGGSQQRRRKPISKQT